MVKVQAFVSVCMAVRSARLAAVSGCWGLDPFHQRAYRPDRQVYMPASERTRAAVRP